MKAFTSHVPSAPLSYIDTDLAGLRTTDICDVGMTIRRPKDYARTIKNLPTGRALRRLLAKHNRKESNVHYK
jgi:hypothetical protein